MTEIDAEAIKARAKEAADFSWMVWPDGPGRKQIGLCFHGASDASAIISCTSAQAKQFEAAIGDVPVLLARLAEVEGELAAGAKLWNASGKTVAGLEERVRSLVTDVELAEGALIGLLLRVRCATGGPANETLSAEEIAQVEGERNEARAAAKAALDEAIALGEAQLRVIDQREALAAENARLRSQVDYLANRAVEENSPEAPETALSSTQARQEAEERADVAMAALANLVELKDGPRDDEYRHRKDAAWDRARWVVHGFAEEDPGEVTGLEEAVEAIRQRLDDLGSEGRDQEGSLDGSLWLDGLDSVAEDLALVAAPILVRAALEAAATELRLMCADPTDLLTSQPGDARVVINVSLWLDDRAARQVTD